MRWVRFTLVVLLFSVATVRCPPALVGAGIVPLFLLVPALHLGMSAEPGTAALLGWLLGFALDLVSLEPLGFHAFVFALAAYLVSRLRGAIFLDHPVTRAVLATAASLLVLLVLLLRVDLSAARFAIGPRVAPVLLMAVVTGVSVPLFGLVDGRLGIFRGFTGGRRHV